MKRFLLLTVFALLASVAFGQTPEAAIERMAQMAQSITDLQSTNDQLGTFNADLDAANTNQGLVAARQTTLIATGEGLKTDIHAIAADRKTYEAEVRQHDAQCPPTTTDPAVADPCNAWWGRLETMRKGLGSRTKDWTARKNGLLSNMKQWDKDTTAAAKAVQYLQFSIDSLERAKTRILNTLGQLNQNIINCRAAIANASEEEMVERCGQMWDGNALHPALIYKGTGSKNFGTGGNPTNNSEPHN